MNPRSAGRSGEPSPFWFGPDDRPLFGWLHLPRDRTVRGGVVLCQPLGIEAICVYYTYRLLADRLAEQGLAVLRFDYDGTGDSTGQETDPDRVEAWLSSVTAAADVLVGAGVSDIGLVGVRIGGLFAANEAVRRSGVDALVLWDPCLSGQSFVREQRFLRHLSDGGGGGGDGGGGGEDALEAPGLRFEPETVEGLGGLDLAAMDGTLAKRILVLVPPGTSRPRVLQRRLDGLDVEWQEATGQDLLLDSHTQTPPMSTIDRVVDWLAAGLQGPPVTLADVPVGAATATVGTTPAGLPVVEHTVHLGGLGLFGIVTDTDGPPRGPTIVLVNEGNTHHIGQARIWVDLARRLGPLGFRILRFDLSGNGDSRTRPGQPDHVARAPEAIADVYDAMTAISPDDPTDVVLVGFCSGAYQVVEQALLHPPRGICVINPSFSFTPPTPEEPSVRRARQHSRRWLVQLVGAPLRSVVRRRNPADLDRWVRSLENGSWPMAMAKRRPGIPEWFWRFVTLRLLEDTGINAFERIEASGVDTFLVCGPADYLPIALGSGERIRALERSPRFHVAILDDLDHASWAKRQRELLIDVMVGHFESAHPTTAT